MKNYTEIKTFEDACKVLKLNADKVVPNFSGYPKKNAKDLEAHSKLLIVVEAANKLDNSGKTWTPDWSDWNERKYEPWFDMEEGSSGFRSYDFVSWVTGSCVGSRLCFKSREACQYIANQFIDLYKEYMI